MQLVQLITDSLVDKLTIAGWQPLPNYDVDDPTFVRRESDQVSYNAGMSMGIHDHGVSINPSFGVVHSETSRLNGQFLGRKPSIRRETAMIGTTLMDLLPDEDSHLAPIFRWGARSLEDVQPATKALVSDLETYALPFLRSMPTLGAVIARLETVNRHAAQDRHLAIAYALTSRMPEALALLQRFADEAQTQQPPLSTQSWRFIRSFIEHFGIDEASLPYEIGR